MRVMKFFAIVAVVAGISFFCPVTGKSPGVRGH